MTKNAPMCTGLKPVHALIAVVAVVFLWFAMKRDPLPAQEGFIAAKQLTHSKYHEPSQEKPVRADFTSKRIKLYKKNGQAPTTEWMQDKLKECAENEKCGSVFFNKPRRNRYTASLYHKDTRFQHSNSNKHTWFEKGQPVSIDPVPTVHLPGWFLQPETHQDDIPEWFLELDELREDTSSAGRNLIDLWTIHKSIADQNVLVIVILRFIHHVFPIFSKSRLMTADPRPSGALLGLAEGLSESGMLGDILQLVRGVNEWTCPVKYYMPSANVGNVILVLMFQFFAEDLVTKMQPEEVANAVYRATFDAMRSMGPFTPEADYKNQLNGRITLTEAFAWSGLGLTGTNTHHSDVTQDSSPTPNGNNSSMPSLDFVTEYINGVAQTTGHTPNTATSNFSGFGGAFSNFMNNSAPTEPATVGGHAVTALQAASDALESGVPIAIPSGGFQGLNVSQLAHGVGTSNAPQTPSIPQLVDGVGSFSGHIFR